MKEIDEKLFKELSKDDLDEDIEVKEESKSKVVNEEVLDEGTSNFPTRSSFPLYVFYTFDEFLYNMTHDPDYPQEEQFEGERGNGDFYVDWDAFDDAKDKFEQDYWDNNDICVLDEDEQERLESKLDDFNDETNNIANNLYDADNDDDYYALKDIELKIAAGYYEAAYIDVDGEEQFNYMSEDVAKEQRERFNNFLKELSKEFGLTKLGVAWGPASNGETGFKILKDEDESLEEDTIKKGDKWVNKGREGTHGEFKTKKQADAQRKAMFANGYKENLKEGVEYIDSISIGTRTIGDGPYHDGDGVIYILKDDDKYYAEYAVENENGPIEDPQYLDDVGEHDSLEELKVALKEHNWIKEEITEKKRKLHQRIGVGLDLAKDTAMTNKMLNCTEDFDEFDTDSYYNEDDICIYQFPQSLNSKDFKKAKEYGLEVLGKVNDLGFQPGDPLIKGTYANLKKYCEEYLDYVMHPWYLYKEGDIDLEDTLEPLNASWERAEALGEDKHQDEYGLPREVTIDLNDLYFEDEDELDDVISDYLSDEYGFCHYGFNWEYSDDAGYIDVYDIDWDTSESLKEENKESLNEDTITNDKSIDAIKDEVNPSDVIPQEEQEALAKGELVEENLDESMKSEVTNWWKDVEDANREMKWGINIDNGDYSDVEAMHAAMFDMLDELDNRGAGELFKKGKAIYNKYAKYSKYNESIDESCGDKELIDKLVAFGSCEDEKEAQERVAKMSQEEKDAMCKSLQAQAKDHLLNDSLNEEKEVARVEYCVMDNLNNNIECFDNTEDAIAFAKDNEGVRVLEVQYGPKNDKGDEPELSCEEVWSIREDLEEGKTSAQRYNDNLHAIFRTFREQNEKMAKFLLDHGVSQEEVDELKANTGLHGNALHQKLVDLELDDEFFERKQESCKESKEYKAWSIKTDSLKEEITILLKNKDNVWEEFAQVENCPTKDMLKEDVIKTYSFLVSKVLKEHDCKILKEEKLYCVHLKVKNANGKVIKEEDLTPSGTKKEIEELKKHLEEVSPEDSHHNRNFYSIKQL